MITNPVLLTLLLVGIVASVLALENVPLIQKVYRHLPGAFWCYFIPMLLASLGVLPPTSKVYTFLTTYVLAACLILLLLDIRLGAILKLGPIALSSMAVGAIGIAGGAVAAYAIFARWLPDETWKGVGALSASWIGGSANMLAVKEGLHCPDSVFAPMVIVDTVITYSWMGLLVALAPYQERWDAWVKADRHTLEDVVQRIETHFGDGKSSAAKPALWHAIWLMGGGMAIGWVCLTAGNHLPSIEKLGLTSTGWAFILITFAGIALSLTPASRLERYGASRWGYFSLYLLLAAIGSKAQLQYILKAPLLIVMAYVWVSIHALLLGVFGYFFRIPMFFLVSSSQANIGGTASTPIVSGVYQPRLASLGLLLAISGNVIGTYAGILIAQGCHFFHP